MDSTLCRASVADVFGIHERSLQALLRNETQLSFAAYLEKIRLEQSMTLLTGTNLSIAEIALQVGYSNDRSFRRAFKRHYDKTPTELRQPPRAKSRMTRTEAALGRQMRFFCGRGLSSFRAKEKRRPSDEGAEFRE